MALSTSIVLELAGRVAADAADTVQHSRRRPEVDAHQDLAVGEADDPLAGSDVEAPVAVPVVLTVAVEELRLGRGSEPAAGARIPAR